jgi:ankyrin repeat protein
MAVVANDGTDDQPVAAASGDHDAQAPPVDLLAPELLMAARLGDSKQLKELLHLRATESADDDDDERAGAEGGNTAAEDMPPMTAEQVVLQVDPPADAAAQPSAAAGAASLRIHDNGDDSLTHAVAAGGDGEEGTRDGTTAAAGGIPVAAAQGEIAAAPAAAPLPPLDGAAVTIEGDSLLHVVAASGDGDKFLHCAEMIVLDKKDKGAMRQVLEARNRRKDTPLHCAAAAGNAKMISCLLALAASTADETDAAAAVTKAFLEAQNEYGETALHHLIKRAAMMHNRHAFKNTPASMSYNKNVVDAYHTIESLMSVDPDLACIVTREGISPLYLAISLGEMEIARCLILTAKEGDLSYYSGPDGQNILHAAVLCGHTDGDL